MPRRPSVVKKRRSTFSNVAQLEPHGRTSDISSAPVQPVISEEPGPSMDRKSSRDLRAGEQPVRIPSGSPNARMSVAGNGIAGSYYQITGDSVHLIDADEAASITHDRRHDSHSSMDSTDFLDHRQSVDVSGILGAGTGSRPDGSGRPSYFSNKPVSADSTLASPSMGRMPSGSGGSSAQPANPNFNSPSLVERFVRRRSSLSRLPLLLNNGNNTKSPNSSAYPRYQAYSSLETGNDDSFAIDVDDSVSVNDPSDRLQYNRRGFLDASSDVASITSKPSTRRGSDTSSLHDVCYPIDSPREVDSATGGPKIWPDLEVLTDFAEEELRELMATQSAAAIQPTIEDWEGDRPISPFSIPAGADQPRGGRFAVNEAEAGGRLRPHRIIPWGKGAKRKLNGLPHLERQFPGVDEKAAMEYRFTYFREDMEATIHSPTISGLLQPEQTFSSLFPPRLASETPLESARGATPALDEEESNAESSAHATGSNHHHNRRDDPVPFWLDVLNPTEEEMKVISKTFGIHPLTTEDIFLGETREKVELFRNYYLVCFRSIDTNSERRPKHPSNRSKSDARASAGGKTKGGYGSDDNLRLRRGSSDKSSVVPKRRKGRVAELRPLNMYIIVFHEGVISFHFAPTTHTVNVRRRARLLRDYLTVSSDWISYALIDDITDGFAPMIEAIEEDVNSIEDSILKMHSGESDSEDSEDEDDDSSSGSSTTTYLTNKRIWKEKGDMLRRIGECRKRVMSLLRLLGNKADVIKGFSKRCNEQWEVAPRNEIGMYLGDIQDHIITMVQSLNHYEKLLARSHSNYLAQINIDMTKANNDMNDVLGRITVLGSIVLPMNIVTGLWGMNVLVPGQEMDSLTWFWSICGSLFAFGLFCYWAARRLYKVA